MNQLSEKAKIGKVVQTREGLTALRTEIMKTDALGKSMTAKPYQVQYKLPGSILQFLIKAGAVEDKRPNASKAEGKYLKWIYTKSGENGPVDAPLVDRVIQLEKDQATAYRLYKKELKGEPTIAPKVIDRVPKKSDKQEIVEWVKNELSKDELLDGGYLKGDAVVIYNKILRTFQGIEQLREALKNIEL